MSSFGDYLDALGGLHDAVVHSIEWNIEAKSLALELHDLYANFVGLQEYPGNKGGTIVLRGLSQVQIAVDHSEKLRIFEIVLLPGSQNEVVVKFSPAGRMTARFTSAEYPSNALLQRRTA